MISSDAKDRTSEPRALPGTDRHYQNVLTNKMNRHLNKPQAYKERMVARMGKYEKRMKSLIKAYSNSNKDSIAESKFQLQLKDECDLKNSPKIHFQ